jgi:RNA polymerase sigma factor (sigma-70 family)
VISDCYLVRADGSRFGELVDRHAGVLFHYFAARVGRAEAEDLTSEVFVLAFAARTRFDPLRGTVRAWLFGIATNLVRRRVRDEERMLRAYARNGVDPAAPPTDEVAVFDSRHAQLAGALAELRREHRDALLLTAVAGLSAEEAAAALGVPSATLRSWVARARAQVTRALSQPAPSGLKGVSP